MVLIVCIDDHNGLMFNKRRVSSDKAVIADICDRYGAAGICISPYSASLFQGHEAYVTVSEEFLNNNANVCFAECGDFVKVKDSVDTLVLYKWNRSYPSDIKFPADLYVTSMNLQSSEDFAGNSHSCITREVYVR